MAGLGLPPASLLLARVGQALAAGPCLAGSPGEPQWPPHPNPREPPALTAPWHTEMQKRNFSSVHAKNGS